MQAISPAKAIADGSLGDLYTMFPDQENDSAKHCRLNAVYFNRIYEPIGVTKRLRLRSNIRVATRIDLGTGRGTPDTTCPVSAEGDVKDLRLSIVSVVRQQYRYARFKKLTMFIFLNLLL